VVTDGLPSLVDSVTNEPTRQNRCIHVVIHPQFSVRDDLTGKLLEIPASRARWGRGQVTGHRQPAPREQTSRPPRHTAQRQVT
jgi:NAD-specific glutamate dehydrogenase